MTDCLFCNIVSGKIPSEKVYEDTDVFAFLDIHPVNIGHTLVIPKGHHQNLYETPDETLSKMLPILKKVSLAVKNATNADGINLEMNNESAAGQIIFHAHIHIIPRFNNDGFKHWKGLREYNSVELREVAQKISSIL